MNNSFNALDAHDAANHARDIRGAYMAQSLSAWIKAAVDVLADKAPQAGHRAHTRCTAA